MLHHKTQLKIEDLCQSMGVLLLLTTTEKIILKQKNQYTLIKINITKKIRIYLTPKTKNFESKNFYTLWI